MSESSVHQIKPLVGYKQTDLGLLPNCWDSVLIGDLFVFKNGLNKAKRFFGTGTPIVNYMDVFERPGLMTDDLSGRVNLSPEEIKNFEVRLGDVFFTRTSETVEDVGVASVMLDEPCDTVFSGFVLRARPRDGHLNDRFKQYCFATRAIRSQIVSNATYTTRALTNGRTLSAVRIAVPPKPEQRAITEALSDVDGLLGALDGLLAKKRAIKQEAMQQLLTGKTRLPGFSREWETTTLGGVADIRNGATPSTQITAFWNGSIPWCTPTDITSTLGKYLLTTERSITAEGLTSCAASLLPAGALLLCSRATIGEIKIAASPVCTNQGFKSLVCKDGVSNEFLYYLLVTLKPQMIERAIGSTFLEIGKRDVAAIEVRLPPSDEQSAIATFLSDMDAEIAALERRRDKIRAIKQGMMQALLTGRVRLVKPELAADQETETSTSDLGGARVTT